VRFDAPRALVNPLRAWRARPARPPALHPLHCRRGRNYKAT
jgi:hypothetical protein